MDGRSWMDGKLGLDVFWKIGSDYHVEKGENEAANLGSPSVPCCLIWSSNHAQDYRGRRLVSDLIFKYKETISISRKISYPNQPARYKSTRDIQLGLQDIYSI
jgi:hypothetical protein